MYGLNQSLLGLGSSVGSAFDTSAWSQQMQISYQQQMLHYKIKQQELELTKMGINPFCGPRYGVWMGPGGPEDILEYDTYSRTYRTSSGRRIDRDEVERARARMTGLQEVKEPDKLKVTKDYLIQRRQARWDRRMIRIAAKKWERRYAVATEFGWKVGSTWAMLLTLIASIYGLKWVSHVILG